jgi:Flp pilus assembly protein TadG
MNRIRPGRRRPWPTSSPAGSAQRADVPPGLPHRPGDRAESRQRGFVTAETALVLPTLLGLGFALAFVIAAVADRIRCTDAAWEAARVLARGESSAVAAQAVHQLAPRGASMSVDNSGGHVSVQVSTALAFGNAMLPVLHVDGRAQAACEPGTPCASVDSSAAATSERRP